MKKQKIFFIFFTLFLFASSSFARSLIVPEEEKEFKQKEIRNFYQILSFGYSFYNNNNYENKNQSKENGVRFSFNINKPLSEKFSYGGGFSLYYSSEDIIGMDMEIIARFFFNRIYSGPFLEGGAGYIWISGGGDATNGIGASSITGDGINLVPLLKAGLGFAIETIPDQKAIVTGINIYHYFNKEFGKLDTNQLTKHNVNVFLFYIGVMY